MKIHQNQDHSKNTGEKRVMQFKLQLIRTQSLDSQSVPYG